MKKMKRILSAAMVLLLMATLSVNVFAMEWFMEDGDITVNAGDSNQTVTQGAKSAADDAPVITQRDSSAATESTITVTTTGDGVAELTIKDVNIVSKSSGDSAGDAIDIENSKAEITLEGSNTLYAEGSAIHVSGGDLTLKGSGTLSADTAGDLNGNNQNAEIGSHEDEDMSGSIHITDGAVVTMKDHTQIQGLGDGAGIGSGKRGSMSGTVTIDGNANVTAFSRDDGAGIGSGQNGDMSGKIIIEGESQVVSGSGCNGAGIGSGYDDNYCDKTANMTGQIIIQGNSKVTAWSADEGAGIGTGRLRNEDRSIELSGQIIIGGNAQVTAGSDCYGAGIGTGGRYHDLSGSADITSSGQIIIKDSAQVTAVADASASGIGTGYRGKMDGSIVVRDNAKVTAFSGSSGASIGSAHEDGLSGSISLLGNSSVVTQKAHNVQFNYQTKTIEYEPYTNYVGRIGNGGDSSHDSESGHYIIGPNVTINGIQGSNTEALKKYINMRLSGDEHDGDPENLIILNTSGNIGTITFSGKGTVEKILYKGSETLPTEPGNYSVTVVLRLDDDTTIDIESVELIIQEQTPDPEPVTTDNTQTEPIYRVTDKYGSNITYKAEQKYGVLTITVDADCAVLTGTLSGINTLKAQGVEELVFVTKDAASTFVLADLLANGSTSDVYKLTHNGTIITFTLGVKGTDVGNILEKA